MMNPLRFAYFGYGARLFGRTLHIPGVLFVETRFLHAWLFPLVPRSSWVTLNEEVAAQYGLGTGPYKLTSMNWRSVVLTFLRTTLIAALFIGLIVISTQVLLERSFLAMAPTVLALVVIPTLFWFTYRLDRPTHGQLQVLTKDLPEDLVRYAASRIYSVRA
jgi:hypothetical protein